MKEELALHWEPIDSVKTQDVLGVFRKVKLTINFRGGRSFEGFLETEHLTELAYLNISLYILKHRTVHFLKCFDIKFGRLHFSIHDVRNHIRDMDKFPQEPEKWPGKWQSTETLPDFFRRVWGKYLSSGLTLAYLRKTDPDLCEAIRNYKKSNLDWPTDLVLPTQRTLLADAEKRLVTGEVATLSSRELLAVARKRQRLGSPNI